jgi:hypothetical protein
MHYLEELIAGKGGKEHIHRRFVRYSRGEFSGAAVCIKKDGAVLKVTASEDYANSLGKIITEGVKDDFAVSGSIFSREDASAQIKAAGLDVKKAAKKKGVYATEVAGTLQGEELSRLYSQLEGAHMLLELKSKAASLKTKKKLPKPAGGVDEKFCSATMPAEKLSFLLKEICSDPVKGGADEITITHTYAIKELAVPEEYKNDYALARTHAKRKGTIKRTIDAGGSKTTVEHGFSA